MQDGWTDDDTRLYLTHRDVFVPRLAEFRAAVLAALLGEAGARTVVVDLGAGDGALSAAILRARPAFRVVLVERSGALLDLARTALDGFGDRVAFLQADLRDRGWIAQLPDGIGAFASTLALHHLEPAEHAPLCRALHDRLGPGGVLVIGDVVRAETLAVRRYYADCWNAATEAQSRAVHGDDRGRRAFVESGWNSFEHPDDPTDRPLTTAELLTALGEGGFRRVDILWAHAGHQVTAAWS